MRVVGFVLLAMAHGHRTYYKRMLIDGKQGCVQARVSDLIARRMKATPGTCADVDCHVYKGDKSIPFVGVVEGYYCE